MLKDLQEIKDVLVQKAQQGSSYTETVRWFELLQNLEASERKWKREDKSLDH